MPSTYSSSTRHTKCLAAVRPQQPVRRGTLRDLYTSGLVSIFRRDSIFRVWEPLRESPSARSQQLVD